MPSVWLCLWRKSAAKISRQDQPRKWRKSAAKMHCWREEGWVDKFKLSKSWHLVEGRRTELQDLWSRPWSLDHFHCDTSNQAALPFEWDTGWGGSNCLEATSSTMQSVQLIAHLRNHRRGSICEPQLRLSPNSLTKSGSPRTIVLFGSATPLSCRTRGRYSGGMWNAQLLGLGSSPKSNLCSCWAVQVSGAFLGWRARTSSGTSRSTLDTAC